MSFSSSAEQVAVLFDNEILALKAGQSTITVTDGRTGKTGQFTVSVRDKENSWPLKTVDEGILNNSLWSGYRELLNYNETKVRELFKNAGLETPEYYIQMGADDFIKMINEDILTVPNAAELGANKYQLLSRYLVLMHRLTGNTGYLDKAAMVLYYQAQCYPKLLAKQPDDVGFFEGNNSPCSHAVFAFGYLLNQEAEGYSAWEKIAPSGMTADGVKTVIVEMYLRPMGHNCLDRFLIRGEFTNIDEYGARTCAALASILHDPYLARKVVMIYDGMLTGEYYYFDGMWGEATTSYGDQVSGNIAVGVQILSAYEDPEEYSNPKDPQEYGLNDLVMGIKFKNTDLSGRWKLLDLSNKFGARLAYPDGTAVSASDCYHFTGAEARPVEENRLHNLEFPGLAYYGLVQGNTENAVHAGLLYQAAQRGFAGGHEHANILSMTLWGAGTELLGEPGYVNRTTYSDTGDATTRYPSMRPVFHNMPWIFRSDGANESSSGLWSEPRLLAYDNSEDNGGIVDMVEASDVGPKAGQAEINRRLLMNIRLDDKSSYVFNLSRMKGGDAHEIFMRGSEVENMNTSESGIIFTDTGADSLSKAAPFDGISGHSIVSDMSYLKEPKKADGSSAFSLTWEGDMTGSRLTTYMNGVDGSQVYLSTVPTPTRISSKQEEAVYVAPHLTRYNPISGDALTKYAAVYETAKKNETDLIEKVEWFNLDDDEMGIISRVTSKNFIDYIYISGDTKVRTFEGHDFAGKTALVRVSRKDDTVIYSYVYGEGRADKAEGIAVLERTVIDLQAEEILLAKAANRMMETLLIKATAQKAKTLLIKEAAQAVKTHSMKAASRERKPHLMKAAA